MDVNYTVESWYRNLSTRGSRQRKQTHVTILLCISDFIMCQFLWALFPKSVGKPEVGEFFISGIVIPTVAKKLALDLYLEDN